MRLRNKVIWAGVGCYILYTALFVTAKYERDFNSIPIDSEEELVKVIAKERLKYPDQSSIKILPDFDCERFPNNPAYSWKVDDNIYQLCAKNDVALRHEIRHILGGHLEDGNLHDREGLDYLVGKINYNLYYEPSAALAELDLF